MAQAKSGDTVKVHYTGKLEDGTVFATSINSEPMQLTIGEGQVIPGFEQAVVGMSPGESKTAEVPANKAFGPHRKEMVAVVERSQLPVDSKPEVGEQLQIHRADGRTIEATVTNASESSVTLDANHPLAGEDLAFDIQLIQII